MSRRRKPQPPWLSRAWLLCIHLSLAPKCSTQLFSIRRPQVLIAKLIRGYLRGKKTICFINRHAQKASPEPAEQTGFLSRVCSKQSQPLPVGLQLSLCSEGKGVTGAPKKQPGLGELLCQSSREWSQRVYLRKNRKPGDF